jgi:tRNA (guanine6-N2)-methyltransferase
MAKANVVFLCEAEAAEGLEVFARDELAQKFPQSVRLQPQCQAGSVQFTFSGDLRALAKLKLTEAVFLAQSYPVPRPRALLGDANFRLLLQQVETVLALYPGQFHTLYLSAAGSESSVMSRIKQDVGKSTGLRPADDKGDLLLRIRPTPGGTGWDTLVRLTPRPLVTRAWRVCNYEGALNATVAHAMVLMTRPRADDVFVNLGCGSGTFLLERRAARGAAQIIGIDHDGTQLACARANIAASAASSEISLIQGDMLQAPLPGESATSLCMDLPFGQKVGSHEQNRTLYPDALKEAFRIAAPRARLALITHEIRLMERLLAQPEGWIVENAVRVTLRGLHPQIYVLQKPD